MTQAHSETQVAIVQDQQAWIQLAHLQAEQDQLLALCGCINNSIAAKLLVGARALPFSGRHHFDLNVTDLLDKSTQHRRNWLLNVLAAQQRHERQQAAHAGMQTAAIANSQLTKWMATGRAS